MNVLAAFGIAVAGTFILSFILVPIFFALVRFFGLYSIVYEGTCQVFTLFGKVYGVLDKPGLNILPVRLGLSSFLLPFFGRKYVVDLRLDQRYLRSQPVNSEEGAPMGIGVWYEKSIKDPVSYLFKNANPEGSLAANVNNAVVRTLSNLPLEDMLEDRHAMSRTVRVEVSPKSAEWGYGLGSVYIRKVHFRDRGMIQQIEEKVVNRLRQVTSAITQDGANQVSIITSTADRRAAIEFAKAEAMRPRILGEALHRITTDSQVAEALFSVLEAQNIVEGKSRVTLVQGQNDLLTPLLAAESD